MWFINIRWTYICYWRKKIDDIKNYIKEIKKDKIIIVISHEDYWKTLADEIITIEDYFN